MGPGVWPLGGCPRAERVGRGKTELGSWGPGSRGGRDREGVKSPLPGVLRKQTETPSKTDGKRPASPKGPHALIK